MKKFLTDSVMIRSWWVIAFTLFCFAIYERGIQQREQQFQQLNEQLQSLQAKKQEALSIQQDLQRQINSQSDLAWIELTLMKGLGICPEEQQKVYFLK